MSFVTRHIPGIVTQDEIAGDRADLAVAQGKLAASQAAVTVKSAEIDATAASLGIDRDRFMRLAGNYDREKSSISAARSAYQKDGSRANDDLNTLVDRSSKGLNDTDRALFMLYKDAPLSDEVKDQMGAQALGAIQNYRSQRADITRRLLNIKSQLRSLDTKDQELDKVHGFGGIVEAYKSLVAQKNSNQREVNEAQAELNADCKSFSERMAKEAAAERQIGSFFGDVSRWFNKQADQDAAAAAAP